MITINQRNEGSLRLEDYLEDMSLTVLNDGGWRANKDISFYFGEVHTGGDMRRWDGKEVIVPVKKELESGDPISPEEVSYDFQTRSKRKIVQEKFLEEISGRVYDHWFSLEEPGFKKLLGILDISVGEDNPLRDKDAFFQELKKRVKYNYNSEAFHEIGSSDIGSVAMSEFGEGRRHTLSFVENFALELVATEIITNQYSTEEVKSLKRGNEDYNAAIAELTETFGRVCEERDAAVEANEFLNAKFIPTLKATLESRYSKIIESLEGDVSRLTEELTSSEGVRESLSSALSNLRKTGSEVSSPETRKVVCLDLDESIVAFSSIVRGNFYSGFIKERYRKIKDGEAWYDLTDGSELSKEKILGKWKDTKVSHYTTLANVFSYSVSGKYPQIMDLGERMLNLFLSVGQVKYDFAKDDVSSANAEGKTEFGVDAAKVNLRAAIEIMQGEKRRLFAGIYENVSRADDGGELVQLGRDEVLSLLQNESFRKYVPTPEDCMYDSEVKKLRDFTDEREDSVSFLEIVSIGAKEILDVVNQTISETVETLGFGERIKTRISRHVRDLVQLNLRSYEKGRFPAWGFVKGYDDKGIKGLARIDQKIRGANFGVGAHELNSEENVLKANEVYRTQLGELVKAVAQDFVLGENASNDLQTGVNYGDLGIVFTEYGFGVLNESQRAEMISRARIRNEDTAETARGLLVGTLNALSSNAVRDFSVTEYSAVLDGLADGVKQRLLSEGPKLIENSLKGIKYVIPVGSDALAKFGGSEELVINSYGLNETDVVSQVISYMNETLQN